MAAPTYVQAGTGVVIQTGTSTVQMTSVTEGNIVVLQVLQDGTAGSAVSLATFGGCEALDGTNNTVTSIGTFNVGGTPQALMHLWIGRHIFNAGTAGIDVTTTGNDLYCRMYEFTNGSTGTTLATVIENSTAGSTVDAAATSGTIADAGVTTLGADRLALNFVAINDDNAVAAYTGMTGGTWGEAVAEYATATGTDGCIQLQTAAMASAGTVNGGTATNSDAADGWGVVGFALIGTTVASAPSLLWNPAAPTYMRL